MSLTRKTTIVAAWATETLQGALFPPGWQPLNSRNSDVSFLITVRATLRESRRGCWEGKSNDDAPVENEN